MACVSDLFLFSPCVSPLCSHKESWKETQLCSLSLLFCRSLCPVSSSATLLYVFLLLSSILCATLDEVQLCSGHLWHGTATTSFPISSLFFHSSSPCLSVCKCSSSTDCFMGLGVCLLPLLFEIPPLISAFIRTPLMILYICCLSSHGLLIL